MAGSRSEGESGGGIEVENLTLIHGKPGQVTLIALIYADKTRGAIMLLGFSYRANYRLCLRFKKQPGIRKQIERSVLPESRYRR